MDEFGIIARYFAPLAGEGAFGLTDDVALLPQRPGHDLLVTTDAITEGVDFFGFDPSASIARKALRVNLSDLAAKGAVPAHYLLNLSLPHAVTPDWLAGFAEGLAADQNEYGVTLLGGDTGATDGPLSIAVTAFGFVPSGKICNVSDLGTFGETKASYAEYSCTGLMTSRLSVPVALVKKSLNPCVPVSMFLSKAAFNTWSTVVSTMPS